LEVHQFVQRTTAQSSFDQSGPSLRHFKDLFRAQAIIETLLWIRKNPAIRIFALLAQLLPAVTEKIVGEVILAIGAVAPYALHLF
jgi:hypothetical protein